MVQNESLLPRSRIRISRARQRMPGGGDQDHLISVDVDRFEPRKRRLFFDKAKIDFAIEHWRGMSSKRCDKSRL